MDIHGAGNLARGIILLWIASMLGCTWRGGSSEERPAQLVFTQMPIVHLEEAPRGTARLQSEPPMGSRVVALRPARPDGDLTVLTKDFAAAADPCVSFDAKRLLFAAKETPDAPWNIYEMELDGGHLRQITRDLGDCREPIYLASASVNPPMFDDKVPWITFTSTASGVLRGQGTSLYVISLEPVQGRGLVLWRTTYSPGGEFSPTVLQDGRVLFSSQQREHVALMTITWDGDNLNPFYGAHEGPAIKTMACEMPNRTVVFVESDGETPDGGGRLARVALRRPLHSREVLSKGGGRYQTPHPLPDGQWLVSYTFGTESYGIYVFDVEKGQPGRKLYDDPEWNDVDAMPISPRPEPAALIPMVEFASVLDVGSLKGTGQLHGMNVYDSDRPEVKQLKPGQVKWARFVEGVTVRAPDQETRGHQQGAEERWGERENRRTEDSPSPHWGGERGGEWPPPFVSTRILGEVPVEPDGSFYANVAGDIPFFIQILDEHRMALYTMQTWMWVRSGSQRGCIGCHEDKELAPENRATMALLRREPTSLIDPPEQRRTVDFRRDVASIIEDRCTRCHSGANAPKGLNLSNPEQAYESLIPPLPGTPLNVNGKYVHPGSARNSPVIWRLFGKQTGGQSADAPYMSSIARMPPDVPLSEAERRIFVEWIDLGARWDNLPEVAEEQATYGGR